MALTTIPSGMIAPAQTFSLNGVTFPATQVPSADANTLDDYEEGTWTPTDVSGAGLTFNYARGSYTKIGRLVQIYFVVNFPVTASSAQVTIGGLPFTPAYTNGASGDQGYGCSISYENANRIDIFFISGNTTKIYAYTVAGAASPNSNYSGSKEIQLVGSYCTA